MSRFLVTGGAGFAGSHTTEELLKQGHEVTVLDRLTYAGPLANLANLRGKFKIVYYDFKQPLRSVEPVDYVIHNGAESHVLNSLKDPELFVRSNVIGTMNLLEWSRLTKPKKFVYVSTDEVFGPAGEQPWHERDVLRPTNPYSATKTGGEFLAHSYFRSFGVPVIITRTVNMFGERQHHEKFVPLVVKKLINNETVDIHVDEQGQVGSRHWLYAGEQARAMAYLAQHGMPGGVYHVASGVRKSNYDMALMISQILGLSLNYRLTQYAWPGHDTHYDIRESPQRAAWQMKENFEELLQKAVLWHRDHQ